MIAIEYEPTKIGARGQRYNVFHNEHMIVDGSTDPLHDGARAILDLGADVDDTMLCGPVGKPWTMKGRVGFLAAHRVTEGNQHGPRMAAWTPYFGPEDGQEPK